MKIITQSQPYRRELIRPLGRHHLPRGDPDSAGESVPNIRIAERREGHVRWIRSLPGQPPLTPVDSLDNPKATTATIVFNGRQPLVLKYNI